MKKVIITVIVILIVLVIAVGVVEYLRSNGLTTSNSFLDWIFTQLGFDDAPSLAIRTFIRRW